MKAPRVGLSLLEIIGMFPDEDTARTWIESIIWSNGRHCGKCGSMNTHEVTHKTMPYRCRDCRGYFSVKTGTPLQASNLPLRKWAIAVYLCLTSPKSVSSMQLHRHLKITQKSAWFMLHRIREAWMSTKGKPSFGGPVEVDETYMGGLEKNKHEHKRHRKWSTEGKVIVLGARDRANNQVRAAVVERANRATVHAFLADHTDIEAMVYSDEGAQFQAIPHAHESVNHRRKEWVRGEAHTNGIESFWATLKRAHKGTFHKMSAKHMQRYVNEFAGRHGVRELSTIKQLEKTISDMAGRTLTYDQLTADNGLPSGARPPSVE